MPDPEEIETLVICVLTRKPGLRGPFFSYETGSNGNGNLFAVLGLLKATTDEISAKILDVPAD